MSEKPAVYGKHPAIDSGSEFRLDGVEGVLRLELGPEIQRISDSAEDLKHLYEEAIPDEVEIKAFLADLEFVRIMNRIREAKTPMTLRVERRNGVDFEKRWSVQRIKPVPMGRTHFAFVTLAAQRDRKIGF